MKSGLVLFVDMLVVLFFCRRFTVVYNNYSGQTLALKQRAYILSMYSSGILSFFGLYFNGLLYMCDFDVHSYTDQFQFYHYALCKLCIHSFTAYLITDMYIGTQDYPSTLKSLTGYVHHVIYIGINMLSLYTRLYNVYVLFMIAEIPTFFLAFGSVHPNYRSNVLFGITFGWTRIAYFSYLVYHVLPNYTLILYLSSGILGLHVYWFSKWVKRYILN
ncbi:hypothetical protein EB118_12395 [bacterium]|nr:hypothetical protein [bacterium]NDD83171.1 hypothetical protein [bacterium]NDG30858.1 hypothetical protein [bacterium]